MNIDGTWRVKATSGPRWFRALNLLRDKKVIKGHSGYNVACGVRWGGFIVTKLDPRRYTLTYTKSPIVDKLYFDNEDKLSGIFCLRKGYAGKFEMVRVKNER